ncbi:MAG: hypothetical protein HQL74_14970 [Magnetococcales bacterium]|nr:hypothetical protein [Magnetococcales bacterium]
MLGNGKSYLVPPYQRDYALQEDLWNDIVEMHENSGVYHYMDELVLAAGNEHLREGPPTSLSLREGKWPNFMTSL